MHLHKLNFVPTELLQWTLELLLWHMKVLYDALEHRMQFMHLSIWTPDACIQITNIRFSSKLFLNRKLTWHKSIQSYDSMKTMYSKCSTKCTEAKHPHIICRLLGHGVHFTWQFWEIYTVEMYTKILFMCCETCPSSILLVGKNSSRSRLSVYIAFLAV